jgi:hypothetical protein
MSASGRRATVFGAGAAVIAGLLIFVLIADGADHRDGSGAGEGYAPPRVNAGFDYQIGGDYPLPADVSVVSRDWFSGDDAPRPTYSICYVNAFQTQADEPGVDRPDERSNWPPNLVLSELGDDPHWGGEYLIDISTAAKRRQAADWVKQMIDGCREKGFEAVEYDNLDSWTRFDGTPLADDVPFSKPQALAYATILARRAHVRELAVAQKNTADVTPEQADRVGFDFAIAEECSRYDECNVYRHVHGNRVIEIEYRRQDFDEACATVGPKISVVLRDRLVSKPGSPRYVYDAC